MRRSEFLIRVPACYSADKAIAGSTRAARRAGTGSVIGPQQEGVDVSRLLDPLILRQPHPVSRVEPH